MVLGTIVRDTIIILQTAHKPGLGVRSSLTRMTLWRRGRSTFISSLVVGLVMISGLSSDWGDYSATSMIGVRWKPARRRRPVQNPPQFSIPQPAAIRAIIPLPLPSPQSLDTLTTGLALHCQANGGSRGRKAG